MKPALQVPLAILVVAALVYIMYSQSQKNSEQGDTASDPVESVAAASEAIVSEGDSAEEGTATEEEAAAIDALIDDEAEDAESEKADQAAGASQTPPKQVTNEQTKRASASLRQRRRNMFKKIDADKKDGIASKEEHDEFFRKAFNFYDKNDDGRLSGKERSQVKRLPRKADVNKDGVLTRKEFLDQFERFFVIMDKDESGDLTEKEFVR